MPVVVLGVVLLVDVLRVWMPSIITIFGQAAATPAEMLGAFALMWFLLAFLAPPLARYLGVRAVGLIAAIVLAAARLALVDTSGQVQLYVAGAGLLAGLCWLVTLATGGVPARHVGLGIAAATVLHAAVGTVDLTWRGRLGWVAVLGLAAAFVALAFRARPAEPSGDPSGGWFLVGPVMFVALQIGLAPAVTTAGVSTVVGPGDGVGVPPGPAGVLVAVLLVTVSVVGFGYLVTRPPAAGWARILCAAAVLAGAAGFGFGPGPVFAAAGVVTAVGLGGCAGTGWARAGTAAEGRTMRPGFATAAGMLVFAVAVFTYYAAYDLGYPNGWVPVVVAVVVAAAARRRPAAGSRVDARVRWAVPVAVLALAAVGAWWAPPAVRPADTPRELRVVAYNIRMAFGLDGRFSIAEMARTIRAERPDVVFLSEVDRGWLLNGGHDDVGVLARELGMRYGFAPAADALWGDAVLTNLPVVSWHAERMPSYGAPTGGQVMGAVLKHGDGEVAVVSTHLQPPPGRKPLEQARDAHRFAADLRAPGRPVIVGGDMNTRPGEDAFAALLADGFTDAFADRRPVPTSPANDPGSQIDHIFLSGAQARDLSVPRTTASDHLPVAVTVTW